MDRCAIFVDAGYLYAAGGDLCCGTSSRSAIDLDAAAANSLLADIAGKSGLPVLRTYWYDGARDGIPTVSHQNIAAQANVKLRLGRINSKNQR